MHQHVDSLSREEEDLLFATLRLQACALSSPRSPHYDSIACLVWSEQYERLDVVAKKELAWDLYWNTAVAADTLAKVCGFGNVKALVRVIGGAVQRVICSVCANEYENRCRTRGDMVSTWWGPSDSRRKCGECAATEAAAKAADIAAKEASAREAEARRELLRTMPYAEYLETPEWQDRRRRKLKQARYRCQTCNGSKNLQVHHRTYERRGSEWDEDLTVLCEGCHALFHGR